MPRRITFTQDERLQIARLYNQGLTLTEVARHFETSTSPILRVLRDMDVPRRTAGNKPKTDRNQKILDMKDERLSDTEIATALGISRQRVHAITNRGY